MIMLMGIELAVSGSTDKPKDNQALAQNLTDHLAEAISNSLNSKLINPTIGG